MTCYLCLTEGFPASGKSTWAAQQAAADPRIMLVSRDDIRAMLRPNWNFDEATNREDEHLVTIMQRDIVSVALAARRPVIVHNTNLYRWQYADLLDVAQLAGVKVHYQRFLDVPIEVCIERDAPRPPGRRVGAEALRRMHEAWQASL